MIILLSGVLFMFLFFLALVIGYGVVYLVFLRKKMIAVLFTICFTLFYVQTKEAPVLYNILWQRFEWVRSNLNLRRIIGKMMRLISSMMN